MSEINVYVGYDPSQEIAFDVCKHSICRYGMNPALVHKINANTVKGYEREFDPLASTPFTYARFYVPYLNNFKGVSIFCDGDFLFLDNIDLLSELYDSNYAVQVVKHNYSPISSSKMNGKVQTNYPKKNWSSLILWNNSHPKNAQLTLDLLNSASGSFLHQFKWLNEEEIGEISHEWNWLVGWYKETSNIKPKALHFTEGGPWLQPSNCEYDELWIDYKNQFNF